MTMHSSLRPGNRRRHGAWQAGGCLLLAAFLAVSTAAGQETATRADRDDGGRNLELADYLSWETVGDPRISPNGTTVVYERRFVDAMTDGIRTELWVIGADGSRNRFLTAGAGARWSPDGTRIAYTAGGQIHLRWMDTGETATLTQFTESPSGLRWSPDGRHIAFNMLVPYPAPSLAAPPRPPEGAEWAAPPIMEDRFKSRQDGVGYLDFGYSHIFVVPVEGGTPDGPLEATCLDYVRSRDQSQSC